MTTAVDTTVALTTLDLAKAFLKIASATTSEDDIVAELVNASGDFANRYTGRHLIQKTYTEYYDGLDRRALILRNYPVISVAHLYDDPLQVFGSDAEILAANFAIDKDGGIIRLAFAAPHFYQAHGNLKVVYDAGFATSAIPLALKECAHVMIASWYTNLYEFKRGGIQTTTQGDRTTQTRDEAVPAMVKTILDSYKNIGAETSFSHD